MNPNYFVGVDLHKSVIQICVLDSNGAMVAERRFTGGTLEQGLEVVGVIAEYRRARVAVEAIGFNRWFVNALRARGVDVLVADPVKLGLKNLGKKTDRRDALEIARRLFLGDLDRYAKTYFPTDAEYGRRKLTRIRHKLVSLRLVLINQVRAILNAYRIPQPTGTLFAQKNLTVLRALCHSDENLSLCIDVSLDLIEATHEKIKTLDRRIDNEARDPRVSALTELPQLGPQTALTLVSELGDVTRFTSARKAASYAGLVPRVFLSAKTTGHHGRITRRGSRELRWILNEWAVRLIATNAIAREWASHLHKRMHKNKVRTALARRLLVGIYVTLRTGEEFSLEKCLSLAAQSSE